MNLEIRPGAALDDAQEIDNIVGRMKAAMEELNTIILNNMGPVGSEMPISTDWAGNLLSEWTNYYSTDIPATMDAMQLSASNLRRAVEGAVHYSQSN